jgi:hypothetical protein
MAADENVAMWERYTSGPESVAIRSRYSSFAKQFHRAVAHIGMVTYIDYNVSALPGMNMLHRITHKRHFFQDEREVRAVVCSISPDEIKRELIDPHMMPDGCGYAPPVNAVELVGAVVLHPEATPEFTEKVTAFCASQGLPAPTASAKTSRPVF